MSDDSLFREVDEELRHEQLKKLWARYGTYITLAAIAIVAAVAGYKGWTWYEARRTAEAGARYEAALELAQTGKEADALKEFEALGADAPGGYGMLARLSQAAYQARTGETKAAIDMYDGLAASASDPAMRDLARIRAALLLLDSGNRADVESRVGAMDEASNPWRHSARELLGLAAYKAGDQSAALSLFQKLQADAAAPQDVRQRVQMMMTLITPEQKADGPANAPQAGAATESR